MADFDLQEGRAFPPLRGGIKGGVTRVQIGQRGRMMHPALPTLIPSPLGREAWRAFHAAHDLPATPVTKRGGHS